MRLSCAKTTGVTRPSSASARQAEANADARKARERIGYPPGAAILTDAPWPPVAGAWRPGNARLLMCAGRRRHVVPRAVDQQVARTSALLVALWRGVWIRVQFRKPRAGVGGQRNR